MTREEQINAHCVYARFEYNEMFKRGAHWADNHPSEEVIRRVLECFFLRTNDIDCLTASDFKEGAPVVDQIVKLIKERI